MSETSSLRRLPSPTKIKAEHNIVLVDHTVSSRAPSYLNRHVSDAEQSDSDAPTAVGSGTLYKRLTNQSTGLRQSARNQLNRQKYSKYSQDRYHVDEGTPQANGQADDLLPEGEPASPSQRGYIERAQSKVQSKAKEYMKRKKTLGRGDAENTVIDVLYENQRGLFFFGIPKYSSASLLPADPRPWQNGQFRTSAVDIRNAQVPDPSWEWKWKNWYVDMSRDVDEEGWEYSFAFVGKGGATFAWHGNHPWFHSFVRRRRWLRMRKRKDGVHRTREKAHELTEDYFTIHPKTLRPVSIMGSRNPSSMMVQTMIKADPAPDVEKMDISTIGDLFLALRKSTVDREKLVAAKRFTDSGGDELFYLGDRMEDIMGMLVFQSSRRQLLSDLISRHQELREEQKELQTHQHGDDDEKQKQHDAKARHAANLHKAIHAADEQVKRLEYWSDMKDISGISATAKTEEGHSEPSFKNKQPASAGKPSLPSHPNGTDEGHETANDTAAGRPIAPSKKSSIFYDAESMATKRSKGNETNAEGDTEPEQFVLAPEIPESAPQISSKGKGRVLPGNLDGASEAIQIETEAEEAHDMVDEQLISASTGSRGNRRIVQIVDPVALDSINGDDENNSDYSDDDYQAGGTRSPVDRGDAKTPDSVRQFMTHMRKPKNWIDQAFG